MTFRPSRLNRWLNVGGFLFLGIFCLALVVVPSPAWLRVVLVVVSVPSFRAARRLVRVGVTLGPTGLSDQGYRGCREIGWPEVQDVGIATVPSGVFPAITVRLVLADQEVRVLGWLAWIETQRGWHEVDSMVDAMRQHAGLPPAVASEEVVVERRGAAQRVRRGVLLLLILLGAWIGVQMLLDRSDGDESSRPFDGPGDFLVEEGECFDPGPSLEGIVPGEPEEFAADGTFGFVVERACDGPHEGELLRRHEIESTGVAFPGRERVVEMARDLCEPLVEAPEHPPLRLIVRVPDDFGWSHDDLRRIDCAVVRSDGVRLVAPVSG